MTQVVSAMTGTRTHTIIQIGLQQRLRNTPTMLIVAGRIFIQKTMKTMSGILTSLNKPDRATKATPSSYLYIDKKYI